MMPSQSLVKRMCTTDLLKCLFGLLPSVNVSIRHNPWLCAYLNDVSIVESCTVTLQSRVPNHEFITISDTDTVHFLCNL